MGYELLGDWRKLGVTGTYTGLKAKGLDRSRLGPSRAHTHGKISGSYAHPLSLALMSAEGFCGLFRKALICVL